MSSHPTNERGAPSPGLPAGRRASAFGLAAGVLAAALWLAARPGPASSRGAEAGGAGAAIAPGGTLGPLGIVPAAALPWYDRANLGRRGEAITWVAQYHFERGDLKSAQAAIRSIPDRRERDIAVNAILSEYLAPNGPNAPPPLLDGDDIRAVREFSGEIADPYLKAIGLSRLATARERLGDDAGKPTSPQLIVEALQQALLVTAERQSPFRWMRSATIAIVLPLLAFVATNLGAAVLGEVGKGFGKVLVDAKAEAVGEPPSGTNGPAATAAR